MYNAVCDLDATFPGLGRDSDFDGSLDTRGGQGTLSSNALIALMGRYLAWGHR